MPIAEVSYTHSFISVQQSNRPSEEDTILIQNRIFLAGCSLILVLINMAAIADTIAIIGTGDVAGALGPRFVAAGHTVVYGSRNPKSDRVLKIVQETGASASAATPSVAAGRSEIVVMAVPAEVAVDVLLGLGDIGGKIIIDPTNAFEITDDNLSKRTTETSMGESLQIAAPDSFVVKALNSVWYGTMADISSSGGPVTVPLAGNDENAKVRVAELLRDIGFDSIDLGPIEYAREIEGMLILWMNARLNGHPFDYYLRQVPGNEIEGAQEKIGPDDN
jgi:predicted dinucleotide-binding enzyme